MTGYVILVDFLLMPGMRGKFRAAIDANAKSSCDVEPGCRRFDVLEPTGETDRILLYEIYDSRAAFEEHLKTPHLAEFEKASAGLVAKKTVTVCNLVFVGSISP